MLCCLSAARAREWEIKALAQTLSRVFHAFTLQWKQKHLVERKRLLNLLPRLGCLSAIHCKKQESTTPKQQATNIMEIYKFHSVFNGTIRSFSPLFLPSLRCEAEHFKTNFAGDFQLLDFQQKKNFEISS